MAYTPYTPTRPEEVDTVTRQWLGGARSPGVGEREKEAAVDRVVLVTMRQAKEDGMPDVERVLANGGYKIEDGALEVHEGNGVVHGFPVENVRKWQVEPARAGS